MHALKLFEEEKRAIRKKREVTAQPQNVGKNAPKPTPIVATKSHSSSNHKGSSTFIAVSTTASSKISKPKRNLLERPERNTECDEIDGLLNDKPPNNFFDISGLQKTILLFPTYEKKFAHQLAQTIHKLHSIQKTRALQKSPKTFHRLFLNRKMSTPKTSRLPI